MLFGFSNFLHGFDNSIAKLLSYVPWVLGKLVEAGYYFAAAVATLVVSPIVLVINVISSAVRSEQYNEVLKLKDTDGRSLREYLAGNGLDANDLRLTCAYGISANAGSLNQVVTVVTALPQMGQRPENDRGDTASKLVENSTKRIILSFSRPGVLSPIGVTGVLLFDVELPRQGQEERREQPDDTQAQGSRHNQAASIKAALGLNMFKAASRISEGKKFSVDNTSVEEVRAALGIAPSLQA